MTQDNTPHGPIFKARLRHDEEDTLWESSRRDSSNATIFGAVTLSAVEKSRIENRSRGCVILCHLRYDWPRKVFFGEFESEENGYAVRLIWWILDRGRSKSRLANRSPG
ncbi:unnamed protein product, partial [Ectocarpus sp. 12 AP-2014]